MTTTAGGKKVFHLRSAHEPVLLAIAQYHYLTAEQVAKLLYAGKSSLNYARELLQELADNGYLDRLYETKSVPVGRSKNIYRLARQGIKHLTLAGKIEDYRYRPSEGPQGEQYLPHTLAINDVLIAASLLPRANASISVQGFRHDIDLRRTAQKVQVKHGDKSEAVTVVPDAWIDLRITTGERWERSPILLELDRGNVTVKRFKQKLRALLAYIRGNNSPYSQVFGTKYVSVVFAVDTGAFRTPTGADHRVLELLRWMEEELHELKLDPAGELFFAGTLQRSFALDPVETFCTRQWFQPFQDAPVSLLDLPEHVPQQGAAGLSTPVSALR